MQEEIWNEETLVLIVGDGWILKVKFVMKVKDGLSLIFYLLKLKIMDNINLCGVCIWKKIKVKTCFMNECKNKQ